VAAAASGNACPSVTAFARFAPLPSFGLLPLLLLLLLAFLLLLLLLSERLRPVLSDDASSGAWLELAAGAAPPRRWCDCCRCLPPPRTNATPS
jgi:hypothetical protein